jgi:hypothetical protein
MRWEIGEAMPRSTTPQAKMLYRGLGVTIEEFSDEFDPKMQSLPTVLQGFYFLSISISVIKE